MKKLLFLLIAIIMANNVPGQKLNTISFTNEIGCGFEYTLSELADIIASCDTLYEEKKCNYLLKEYNKEFPASDPNEPAILILLPNDDYFNFVFVQEDEDGEILTLRILTNEGWMECDAEPYSKKLINLATIISFVQHLLKVQTPYVYTREFSLNGFLSS